MTVVQKETLHRLILKGPQISKVGSSTIRNRPEINCTTSACYSRSGTAVLRSIPLGTIGSFHGSRRGRQVLKNRWAPGDRT